MTWIQWKIRGIKHRAGLLGNILARANPYQQISRQQREIEALYAFLHDAIHDKEESAFVPSQTQEVFGKQWDEFPEGNYLLSDPWFKSNVKRILAEEELLLSPEWFVGKSVLDAGCGNGRWTFGLASLGANVTAVDVNQSALDAAARAVAELDVNVEFVRSPLEQVDDALEGRAFDLVFSWGVVHHCISFNQALTNLVGLIKPNGVLYLYLYGRKGLPRDVDLQMFKERVRYHSLLDDAGRYEFLVQKAAGDLSKVHGYHDMYAPLINRFLTFEEVESQLKDLGLRNIIKTMPDSLGGLFIRAEKGHGVGDEWKLAPTAPMPWFHYHDTK